MSFALIATLFVWVGLIAALAVVKWPAELVMLAALLVLVCCGVIKIEIRELVSRLQSLRSRDQITVAMESTGTYGEALRQALTDAELAVERVRSQATSDYAEIFDGVPSQHDGKDAAMLAELGAIGKSVAWPSRAMSEETALLKAQVQWLTAQQEIWQTWLGRLEGLVSKFWPEATGVVSLPSVTFRHACALRTPF